MADVQRYPLQWPAGWKRTSPGSRQVARFGRRRLLQGVDGRNFLGRVQSLTLADAIARLQSELRMLDARGEILSTNVALRLDGLPRSGQGEPADPGAAVYFTFKGKPRCLACDRWTRVADNLAAIAAHIEAIRAVDRYGVGTMEQAFAGYAQLTAGAQSNEWWVALGVLPNATLEEAEAAFTALARRHHPDVGGSHAEMARLTQAREAARSQLGGR